MIRGIHHVSIHTADPDRLEAFYRDAFGFLPVEPRYDWTDNPQIDSAIGVPGSSARMVMLRAGNCHIELFHFRAPAGAPAAQLRPFDRGYTHFCVDVTDIGAEFDRLTALGMRFTRDRPADFGAIKSVYGHDPDGNLIEIQELADDHPFALQQPA